MTDTGTSEDIDTSKANKALEKMFTPSKTCSTQTFDVNFATKG